MRIQVPATRMAMMKLKRRLAMARRGHKLLKDKQEELLRRILGLIEGIRTHRERVEQETGRVLGRFAVARRSFPPEYLDEAVMLPTRKVTVEVETSSILNIRVPVFRKSVSGRLRCYGPATTSGELDLALLALEGLLDSLLELAEKEKALELLSGELEKTRRRVNALEFVLIPDLEETVKHITLKLAEDERGALTRLMRVKEMIRQ